MNILQKLFKREVLDLVTESKKLDTALDLLESKIKVLKNSDRRSLLHKELKTLIQEYANKKVLNEKHYTYPYSNDYEDGLEELERIDREINIIIEELK